MLGPSGISDGGRLMKAIAMTAAAAALLALTACDRLGIGGGNVAGNDSGNASANASANASGDKGPAGGGEAQAAAGGKDPAGGGAIPAGGGGIALDRAFLTGRWTDTDDCSVAVEFLGDGRFVAANGAEGLWHLSGDRLTLQGDRTVTMQLDPIDRNVMNVVNSDGSLGRSTRC